MSLTTVGVLGFVAKKGNKDSEGSRAKAFVGLVIFCKNEFITERLPPAAVPNLILKVARQPNVRQLAFGNRAFNARERNSYRCASTV